jgi:hypothetical protein
MKRIRLKLTGLGEVLTKDAQEKLDSMDDGILEPTCEDGRTVQEYIDLGFPQDKIPKDLLEKQKAFDEGIELEDEDYEILEDPVRLYEDEIVGYVRSEDITMIFTKTGLTFSVKETVEEIDELIDNN